MVVLMVGTANAQNAHELKNEQIPYGADAQEIYKRCEGEDLKLYYFVPDGKSESKDRNEDLTRKQKRPAIVFFFGGGWVGGTPKQFEMHARYLRSRGMIAILADYRTQKSHGTSPIECVADAKSAIRFVRKHAERLGIDPDRIVAAGGSAGGHIAAAAATLEDFDESSENDSIASTPNALVLFNPVYDNSPGQYGHAKVKDIWQKFSPANNIRKGMPPAIVFFGNQDKLVTVKTASEFQKKMEQNGSRSDLHIYKGAGHGFFNFGRNQNKYFIETVTKADEFLTDLKFIDGEANVGEFVKKNKRPKPKK